MPMHDGRKVDARLYVRTPGDQGRGHVEYAQQIQADPGVTFGLPEVDEKVIPLRAGNCVAYCGRPGHGKSSQMGRLAKRVAKDIVDRGAQEKEIVIYVSWEQVAEELEAFFMSGPGYTVSDYAWGRIDLERVKMQAASRVALPIWMVGHSLFTADVLPPMYLDVVEDAVRSIEEDHGLKPRLMLFDYAQLTPSRYRGRGRTEMVDEAITGTKELLIRLGCPGVVGVQAGRQVDQRDWKVPGMADAQHASSIEQTADKFFGFWRPWLTEDQGGEIAVDGHPAPYQNSPNLFIMGMSKQRMEDGKHVWPMYFNPAELRVEEYEVVALNAPAAAPAIAPPEEEEEIPF